MLWQTNQESKTSKAVRIARVMTIAQGVILPVILLKEVQAVQKAGAQALRAADKMKEKGLAPKAASRIVAAAATVNNQ